MADAITNFITALQANKASSDGVSEPVHVPINLFVLALQEIEAGIGPVATNQSANTVFAGPATGPAALPTFRALVGADLPNPSATTLGGVESFAAVANEFLTQISTGGVVSAAQPATTNLSDVSSGSWTPTDASGASLVFTLAVGKYTKIGNMAFCQFAVTYPSTASSAQAKLGGLPFTIPSATVNEQGFLAQANNANVIYLFDVLNSTNLQFLNNTGGQQLNSTVSTSTLLGTAIFPLT